MVPAAEMIGKELRGGVDFVDVNLGCPIDLVFNQGAGSALMDSAGRLGKILVGMNRALGDIPLTVKFVSPSSIQLLTLLRVGFGPADAGLSSEPEWPAVKTTHTSSSPDSQTNGEQAQ